MSFSGFTENQILTGNSPEHRSKPNSRAVTKSKQSPRKHSQATSSTIGDAFPIPNDARLSTLTAINTKSGNPDLLKNLDESSNVIDDLKTNKEVSEFKTDISEKPEASNSSENKKGVGLKEEKQTILSNDADLMIEKQKKLEEENKQRKAAIRKALEERKSKTTQEAQRIQHV